MIRHGVAPFIECSSKGDKRFSAFYARIHKRGNKSIEDIYQSSKVFANGETNLGWREAKGRVAVNSDECRALYTRLWEEYIEENPELLAIILSSTGLSDVFGQPGHACQATELWKIRQTNLNLGENL